MLRAAVHGTECARNSAPITTRHSPILKQRAKRFRSNHKLLTPVRRPAAGHQVRDCGKAAAFKEILEIDGQAPPPIRMFCDGPRHIDLIHQPERILHGHREQPRRSVGQEFQNRDELDRRKPSPCHRAAQSVLRCGTLALAFPRIQTQAALDDQVVPGGSSRQMSGDRALRRSPAHFCDRAPER